MDELTQQIAHEPGRVRRPGQWVVAFGTLIAVATAGTAADAATAWTVGMAANSAGQARGGTLAAPTGVTSACASNKVPVIVSWTAAANATAYTVSQAGASAGPYSVIATNVAGTSYSFTPGGAGTYYFQVTATRSSWSGPASAPTATPRTVGGGGNCS